MDLDLVIEKLNTLGESAYEYETSHADAGSNYAHLPCESWTEYDDSRLSEYMREKGINYDGLEIDAISDRVLDSFEMESGHMFSHGNGGFLVASYPVGEIEIQIDASELGVESVTDALCDTLSRESDLYVTRQDSSTILAYQDTDCIWDCVVSEKVLREIVAEMKSES